MDSLNAIVHEAVSRYVGRGENGYSYLVANPERTDWTVIFVVTLNGQRFVRAGLVVRLMGEQVLIEIDTNEPPLAEALQQAGIPRRQIVLAYAGEPVPESV
jgi:sulfur carrier protein ThiS